MWQGKEQPKVAVITPIKGPVSATWTLAIKKLRVPSEWVWRFGKGLPIDRQREKETEQVLEEVEDLTHILYLDSDVVPQDPNAIMNLLRWKLPIVAGIYWSKRNCPATWNVTEDNDLESVENLERVPTEADVTGLGFMLVDRRVYENVERPWFQWECEEGTLGEHYKFDGEDAHFLLKAKREGFHTYIDRTVKCGHIIGLSGMMYDASGNVGKCL